MEVRRILVPYDGSEFSENALDYAVYLSNALFKSNPNSQHIKILIFHVIHELPVTKAILDKMTSSYAKEKPTFDRCVESIYQEIRDLMEEDINEKKQKYKFIEGISIESSITYGEPANKIVEYVNDNAIDMIIIGSNGLNGLAKIKGLGSISRKVSENVRCPIIIIR
ncbi:universal stress protein [Candidatus Nitrosocosmicus sp. T]